MGAGQCTLGTADLLCWDGSLLCIGVRRAPPGRSWVSDTGSSSRLGGFLLCRSLRPLPGSILWYWQTSGCPAVRVCTGFLHASRQIPTETEERGPLRTLFGHPLFLCLAVLKSSSPVKQGIERRSLACEVPCRRAQGHLAGEEHSPIPARPAVAPSRRRRPHGERECSFPGFRTEEETDERFTGGGRMHIALPFHCRKPWRSLRKENSPLSSKRRERKLSG